MGGRGGGWKGRGEGLGGGGGDGAHDQGEEYWWGEPAKVTFMIRVTRRMLGRGGNWQGRGRVYDCSGSA